MSKIQDFKMYINGEWVDLIIRKKNRNFKS